MASEFHFFEDTFNQLNSALTIYVSDVTVNVISAITPVATTLLLIYTYFKEGIGSLARGVTTVRGCPYLW